MKPRIGITTGTEAKPHAPYLTVSRHYLDSVVRAGGQPWPLPPGGSEADADGYLAGIDGLLVTGGADVWPGLYGEDPLPSVAFADPSRDRWEAALVQTARDKGIPVFGICRGHQLINVVLGGTLWQDLPSQRPGSLGHYPGLPMDELWQTMHLCEGPSLVRSVFGRDEVLINSFHHQAVKTLAPGLRATGLAADGVVEAYEGDGPFLAGVQFHPEALTARFPEFTALFEAFVGACRTT